MRSLNDIKEPDLGALRGGIDYYDGAILRALRERFGLTEKVAELKIANGDSTYDPTREAEIIARLTLYGKEIGLPDGLVGEVWSIVFRYSREAQEEIRRAMHEEEGS